MRNVPAPASRFNAIPAARRLPDDNLTALIPCGRDYESSAAMAEVDDDDARAIAYWAELEQGMQDWEDDMACQRADDTHAREMAAAVATARASAGVAAVVVGRVVEVGAAEGRRVAYSARVEGHDCYHYGAGDTPAAAVAGMFEMLDAACLRPEFGGFKMAGLAFVSGFPHRSKEEARQLARRIALEPAYLDVALAVHLDGLTDLRPRPAAVAAA